MDTPTLGDIELYLTDQYYKHLLFENHMTNRKGIILAGGSGTRLYPLTLVTSKQLLPVFDKPMIYYPLSTLMLAGVKDILIITTPEDQQGFQKLLGNGAHLGIKLSYEMQPRPGGLAQAFIIGKKFIGDSHVVMILGDNIFHGESLTEAMMKAGRQEKGATVFAYLVNEPNQYGVVELDKDGKPIGIEEKPEKPKSNWAVTGLYYYDNRVVEIASALKPSARGELEITDVNREYMKTGEMDVALLGRGLAWLDAGAHDSLLDSANYIETLEKRQGLKIACVEEVAYRMGYIDKKRLLELADPMSKNEYGKYLIKIANEKVL